MKRKIYWYFLFTAMLLSACSANKFRKLVQRGELAPASFYEVIPLEERLGLYCLEVELKGKPYRFLFDTGAPNVIDQSLGEELGLKKVGSRNVNDSQNRVEKLRFLKLGPLKINDLVFTDMIAVEVDLKSVPILKCLEIDGLIGANLMRKAFWGFDATEQKLTVASELEKVLPKGAYLEVPFWDNAQGTPKIELSLNGIPFKDIKIDYGSTGGLDITESDFREHFNLEEVRLINRSFGTSGTGIFGSSTDTIEYVLFDSLFMEGFKTEGHVVNVEKFGSNKVGMQFLKHYYVALDWVNKKLYVQRIQDSDKTRNPSFGFRMDLIEDKLFITKIYENSPAARAGIQLNDEILEIDHQRPVPVEEVFCDFIMESSDSDVHLKLKRGDELYEVELKKEVLLPLPNSR